MLAVATVTAVLSGAIVWNLRPPPQPLAVSRLAIPLPNGESLDVTGVGSAVALSPDGRTLVYVARRAGVERLYRRDIDRVDAVSIAGTENGRLPFFSPDGESVAFVSDRKLRKVALAGGAPVVISDVPLNLRGATWGEGDAIVFAAGTEGLFSVSASGGTPQLIAGIGPDEVAHQWPHWLPGGRAVLFTAVDRSGRERIMSHVLETGERVFVYEGTDPRYVASGHLVFARRPTSLWAAPFDLSRLAVTGEAVLVETVRLANDHGFADAAISHSGSLAYVLQQLPTLGGKVVRVDGERRVTAAVVDAGLVGPRYPRVSPDGRTLAITTGPGNQGQVWLYDLGGARPPVRLTSEGHNVLPVWSPDGKQVVFARRSAQIGEGGPFDLFVVAADGSGDPEPLVTSAHGKEPSAWSPDGTTLLYQENVPGEGENLMTIDMRGDRAPRPWLKTAFSEGSGRFSPDGRWVVYVSDSTGETEIWVRPYNGSHAPVRISRQGGRQPNWGRDGRTLSYEDAGRLMLVDVLETAPAFQVSAPRVLLDGGFVGYTIDAPGTYDVTRALEFIMIQPAADVGMPPAIYVAQNWLEELKRLVPTN